MTRHEAGGSGAWQIQVLRTLDRVDAIYARLDALSRELIARVDEEEVEELLGLLDQRGDLIESLEALAPEYAAAVGAFTRASSELPEAARAALAGRLAAIDTLASAIAERDAEASRALDRRKASMATEMSEMGQKSVAATAYSPTKGHAPSPRFQDREG